MAVKNIVFPPDLYAIFNSSSVCFPYTLLSEPLQPLLTLTWIVISWSGNGMMAVQKRYPFFLSFVDTRNVSFEREPICNWNMRVEISPIESLQQVLGQKSRHMSGLSKHLHQLHHLGLADLWCLILMERKRCSCHDANFPFHGSIKWQAPQQSHHWNVLHLPASVGNCHALASGSTWSRQVQG